LLLIALARLGNRMRSPKREPRPQTADATGAIRLRGGMTAPARARREVGAMLAGYDEAMALDVMLLLSELVTNSVLHGGAGDSAQIAVNVEASGSAVHVEVLSPRRRFDRPSQREKDLATEGGRGLQIVDAIARSWGIEQGHQTRAWFELPTPGRSGVAVG
jgi:anti-sigma regulatory factor (Ser/Thr protein kinase)